MFVVEVFILCGIREPGADTAFFKEGVEEFCPHPRKNTRLGTGGWTNFQNQFSEYDDNHKIHFLIFFIYFDMIQTCS